jgi:hypothetical protein
VLRIRFGLGVVGLVDVGDSVTVEDNRVIVTAIVANIPP